MYPGLCIRILSWGYFGHQRRMWMFLAWDLEELTITSSYPWIILTVLLAVSSCCARSLCDAVNLPRSTLTERQSSGSAPRPRPLGFPTFADWNLELYRNNYIGYLGELVASFSSSVPQFLWRRSSPLNVETKPSRNDTDSYGITGASTYIPPDLNAKVPKI